MHKVVNITREHALAILETQYGIQSHEVYLLELIPLIEMVWADGHKQEAEVSLVYKFALRRLAELHCEAHSLDVLTAEQVNAFIERLLSKRPSPVMLRELRRLALPVIFDHSDPQVNDRRHQMILEYCLDIGAAAVACYPYDTHERFSPPEKALLLELT